MSRVRPASAADAPAIAGAYEWLFAPPGRAVAGWDGERAAQTLASLVDDPRATVLVAEHDGRLAGFCTVYLDIRSVRYGQRAWVEDLAVAPDRRSDGLGRELLVAAGDWARAHGATHLELDSGFGRTDAHRFYEREQPSWDARSFGWVLSDRLR